MRKFSSAFAVLAAIAFGVPSVAVAQTVPTDGEVRKIDESAGKITIRHGPIKNLDMGAMTMVFRVADPGMLKTVKVGDSVKFEADRINGAITVIKIEKKN